MESCYSFHKNSRDNRYDRPWKSWRTYRWKQVITGTPFTPSGFGNVYVYHDPSGTFQNFTLEALLSPPQGESAWTDNLVVTNDGIMWSSAGASGTRIIFFKKPASGIWNNAVADEIFDADVKTDLINSIGMQLATDGTDLFATSRTLGQGFYLTKITKGAGGWSDPTRETIDLRAYSDNLFGFVLASNEDGDLAVGHVAHPLNAATQNAVRTYSKIGGDWITSTLSATTQSTRTHLFGASMILKDDYVFVGAPRDNSLKANEGKVYIFKKNGLTWDKVGSVVPPVNPFQNLLFGTAMAVSDNFLAVSGYNWKPKGGFLIYKKNNDWSSLNFHQLVTVPDPDNAVIAYGDNVAMDNRWLLIPYGIQQSGLDTKVAIFEMVSDVWQYRQSVSTGIFNIFSKFTTVGVAIDGDTFVAGGKVFTLNATNEWVETCTLRPTDPESIRIMPPFTLVTNGGHFGHAVSIKGNVIVIGAPKKDYGNDWDVGAAYVYVKSSGETWTDRTEKVKLLPDVKQRSGLFGASIFIRENSIVVGAPVDDSYAGDFNSNNPTNIPGKVFVFQKGGTNWQAATLSASYHGNMTLRDNFGIHVAADEKYVYLASSMDDLATGRTSGAVYINDLPPEIEPVGPFCLSNPNGTITLSAQPGGGVWSGTGITDPIAGTFDVSVLGYGEYEVSYGLPGCYSGKTQIIIQAPPNATLLIDTQLPVCPAASLDEWLYVQPVEGYQYDWQYRADPSQNFATLGSTSHFTQVFNRGEYRVQIFNGICETFSETVTIIDEHVDIEFPELPILCETQPGGRLIDVTPVGGNWSGPGIVNNRFSMDGLPNGTHTLTYTYFSALGCAFEETLDVSTDRLVKPLIDRQGHLCKEGVVNLSVTNTDPAGTYTWYRADSGNTTILATEELVQTDVTGNFFVTLDKHSCEMSSNVMAINDHFTMDISPADERTEVCTENDFVFSLPADPDADYEWFYSADGQSHETLQETTHVINPYRSGFYHAAITKGVCVVTTGERKVYIHPKDSVFIPNVITVNGDGKNDAFKIFVFNQDDDPFDQDSHDDVQYAIFNRLGKTIVTSPENRPWLAEDVSAGTYFWLANYHTCLGDRVQSKGWVQVIK